MDLDDVGRLLTDTSEANSWLRRLGIRDARTSHRNLLKIVDAGVSVDLMQSLLPQLEEHLPALSDPDMALNNLERFVAASRSPLALGSLFERDLEALPILLTIFSVSQYLSDVLVSDPESFELLRLTHGEPIAREVLVSEVSSELQSLPDEETFMDALRRIKQRETLRIAYGDLIRGQEIPTVTRQISWLADALCEAALTWSHNQLVNKFGEPRREDGAAAEFVVLALGKLGGAELNYSSDIDLIFLYDEDGKTHTTSGKTTGAQRQTTNREFFERLGKALVRLLGDNTALGIAYRVDMRLRPHGRQAPLVISRAAALRYYDSYGRTWERQALMKSRPIAGSIELGDDFLAALEPWVYRRYLSRADISGIKMIKRRIENRAQLEADERDIKTGHGGLRDIEFVIQFLQLLHGADTPEVRHTSTLEAIVALEKCGCLLHQESEFLAEQYVFLRKIEHRLQLMFDLQTHELPASDDECRKLAIRVGYKEGPHRSPLAAFRADLKEKTDRNRQILDHLLHDAFHSDEPAEPEIDLVLDPEPLPEQITDVLEKYRFRDIETAYQHLSALATESIPFLSTRRCRMFLAAIAPRLLKSIADSPAPDETLLNLTKVSDSLGGKAALWELFSANPPTLKLYTRLCATAPYLTDMLVGNPGMIDELMDSLLVQRLPTKKWLTSSLAELCRGAEDTEPMLHSFKNGQHLRVGVRDIVGKDDIRETHATLADIAETCLAQVTSEELAMLQEKHGVATLIEGDRAGETCEFAILALGKLGGKEPNYHSDLDLISIYEGEGNTTHRRPAKQTSNQHFFSQLTQRILKRMNQIGPYGRLYEVDARLRPTGKSGSPSISLAAFEKYFHEGKAQLWERQSLCKARPVFGLKRFQNQLKETVRTILTSVSWESSFSGEIYDMRLKMEKTAKPTNLKRGVGGTVDIEFIVQALQLKHAAEQSEILTTGTIDALAALASANILAAADATALSASYRLLRHVEARLRLLNTTARHDLPENEDELAKLAYLLDYPSAEKLKADVADATKQNREVFNRILRC